MADFIAHLMPLGLGRDAWVILLMVNYGGAQLMSPWGMVFPHGRAAPRHPSQLYAMLLEGLVIIYYFMDLF